MVFFNVKKDFSISSDDNQINLIFKSPNDNIKAENIYLGSSIEIENLLSMQKDILSILNAKYIKEFINAKEVGMSYFYNFQDILNDKNKMFSSKSTLLVNDVFDNFNKDTINIALIGSFGGGVGDFLCSISALRVFVSKMKKQYKYVNIDLYTHIMIEGLYENTLFFFTKEKYINNIYPLPINIKTLNEYDYYIDTTFFMQEKTSNSLNIVDFTLEKLGISHSQVEDDKKIYNIKTDSHISHLFKSLIEQKAKNKKIFLMHKNSSTYVRSFTDEVFFMLINIVLEDEDCFVVCVDDVKFSHERFLNIQNLSFDYEHLFSIVQNCDCVICPDTSLYHIAQNLNKHSIEVFTTINPKLRVEYYKKTNSIFLNNDILQNVHNCEYLKDGIDMDEVFFDFDVVDFVSKLNKVKL